MKIVSGGQTGVDRVALDTARELGFPTGGWAAIHYWTEDGPDDSLKEFGLKPCGTYNNRTVRNVLDSDGTVIFMYRESAGSRLTITTCKRLNKPYILNPNAETMYWFIRLKNTINIAGNRRSRLSGPEELAEIKQIIHTALRMLNADISNEPKLISSDLDKTI